MKKTELHISYVVYSDVSELPENERKLLNRASQSLDRSYAPYSGFRVGAAVRLDNGTIVEGTNQENVAYPSGLCAERVALFFAASQYPDIPVKSIAITARSADFVMDEPVTPCGSCRQVMAEIESRTQLPIRLIMRGQTGDIYVVEGIKNLLPLMFHADQLKR